MIQHLWTYSGNIIADMMDQERERQERLREKQIEEEEKNV